MNGTDGSSVPGNVPSLAKKANLASIERIVVRNNQLAFAVYNVFPDPSARNLPLGNGWILCTQDGNKWDSVGGAGLPNELFFGMDADWVVDPSSIFVDTDSHVYMSRDEGANWEDISQGLPVRSHCADLRFAVDPSGSHYLYLATFGRSLWRTRLFA